MDDSRRGASTRARSRPDAAGLPDALRLWRSGRALEAFGLRARAREVPGGLDVEIDGRRGRVMIERALPVADCALWPFAAVRGPTAARETLFAAPDQPLLALILERDDELAWRVDGDITATAVRLRDERNALLVHGPGFPLHDLESLLGAAVARARRRAANRPLLSTGIAGPDDFAAAEYDLRRELRRAGVDSIVQTGDERAKACGVLAMYALNDAGTADQMVRALDAEADAVVSALVTGASAAWRGVAPESAAIRSAAGGWLRAAPDLVRAGGLDAWSAAALALAPVAAEVMAAADIADTLRKMTLPAPGAALAQLAAAAGAAPAGRVLGAMHGVLGIAPDAVRGRVGIRYAGTSTLDVEQVAVGDGVLAFRADIGTERATYEVEQTSGGTPLTILLEPSVPGRRLTSARVDDTHAELDVVQNGQDLQVKVQLVADRPRRLELRYER